jgi:prepilin-type N-terminal cleavage/methylation domain-containing protein
MKQRAGFTVIELLITITIMVILLTIAVVNLRGNEASARDVKRTSDVATIAQQLESYYKYGTDSATPTGAYPSTQAVTTESQLKTLLRDLDPAAIRAPNVAASSPMSFTVATALGQPAPTTSTYVYQPIDASGALCQLTTDECRSFVIYYQLETNATIQSVASKNQ